MEILYFLKQLVNYEKLLRVLTISSSTKRQQSEQFTENDQIRDYP